MEDTENIQEFLSDQVEMATCKEMVMWWQLTELSWKEWKPGTGEI